MRTIFFALIVSSLLLNACGSSPVEPASYPETVDWPTAIEILHGGKVIEVVQLHNLSVTLQMQDGSLIKTIEPTIDGIFREIDLCGRSCEGIILVTE